MHTAHFCSLIKGKCTSSRKYLAVIELKCLPLSKNICQVPCIYRIWSAASKVGELCHVQDCMPKLGYVWSPGVRLGITYPSCVWPTDTFFSEVKADRSWSWPLHSHLASEFRMYRDCALSPPHVLIAWCSRKGMGSFIIPYLSSLSTRSFNMHCTVCTV